MKVMILSNFGMGLYKFRKELIEELISNNYEVYISIPYDQEYVQKLKQLGCIFLDTKVDRRGTNPFKDITLLITYIRMIGKVNPDIVLTYTIKPNIFGGFACRLTKTPYLTNITGLGTALQNEGMIRKVMLSLYKLSLKSSSCVFFQNKYNKKFFNNNNIVKKKSRLISGSGVNLEEFNYEQYPEKEKEVRFLFIGRIMRAKGVEELFQAAIKINKEYPKIQFDVVGDCEEDYTQQLFELEQLGIIKYHGHQKDVQSFIKNAHAIILPSYHEGTANVLLESAAIGRPILASRVPGCKETFDENISGMGFEVKNTESLIETIIKFINLSHDAKKEMGIEGRIKMETNYDRKLVINAYIEEINNLRRA